jgi:hypothetical protein
MSKIHPDPLEHIMTTVIAGFQQTTDAIKELKAQQEALESQQKEQARAVYQGMTGSGKSRYVAELVNIEKQKDPRGAQARVADTLNVSSARVTQLLKSDKNRKNGK